MKILIADDSAFMRGILKDIVARSNWQQAEIIEASNGAEALELYRSAQPDLLLLDVVMPERTGIEVLQEIGGQTASVVILSSVDETETINQAKQLGAKQYITKPFDSEKVIAVLNELAPSQGQ